MPFRQPLSEAFWSGSASLPCGLSSCRTDVRLSLAAAAWPGVVVEASLYLFQNMLMLPARDPPLLASCTANFECTVATRVGPIAPELPPSLFVGVVVGQLFASRTTIRILVAEIDKVLFAKTTSCLET